VGGRAGVRFLAGETARRGLAYFLRLDDSRGALVSGKIKFYTPDSARSVKISGLDVPIEYETTTALALTFEGAPVWDFEIAGFRSGDFTVGDGNMRQGLFMLHPHRFGRTPLVLVHCLLAQTV
jgi:hypothetical protein